jgi:hypothetical protein
MIYTAILGQCVIHQLRHLPFHLLRIIQLGCYRSEQFRLFWSCLSAEGGGARYCGLCHAHEPEGSPPPHSSRLPAGLQGWVPNCHAISTVYDTWPLRKMPQHRLSCNFSSCVRVVSELFFKLINYICRCIQPTLLSANDAELGGITNSN